MSLLQEFLDYSEESGIDTSDYPVEEFANATVLHVDQKPGVYNIAGKTPNL